MSTKEYLVQSIVSQMVIYLMDEFRWDMKTKYELFDFIHTYCYESP